MSNRNNILAVLVLYDCRIEDSVALKSLNESLKSTSDVLDMLVYDNSPQRFYAEDQFIVGNINITYISDTSNPGVSKAYNQGWIIAKERGKKWLLLSDQDTIYPQDTLGRYIQQANKAQPISAPILVSESEKIISPCGYKWGRGWSLKRCSSGAMSLHNRSAVNSGMFINLDVFEKVGGYNERIKLDFVDHQWIERAKKHYPTIDVMELVCTHSLSASERDIKKKLVRFKHYLAGAKEYQKTDTSMAFQIVLFLRIVKMSLRFRTLNFIGYYIKYFIK